MHYLRHTYSYYTILWLGCILALFVVASDAMAHPADVQTAIFNGKCTIVGTGFIERLMPCLQNMIDSAAFDFIDAYNSALAPVVYAACTLYVIFYGIQMMYGTFDKPQRDLFINGLKVVIVISFTANMDEIYLFFTNLLIGGINTVTSIDVMGYGGATLACEPTSGTIATTRTTAGTTLYSPTNAWQRLDCLINLTTGLTAPRGLKDGLIAFFSHNFWTGSTGIGIAIIGLYMLFGLITGIFRACLSYVSALVIIAVLVAMGGIFLPLMLFNHITQKMYQQWVKTLISATIQPLVLFMIVNVALSFFDLMVSSGENAMLKTFAGNALDYPDYTVNDYMNDKNLLLHESAGIDVNLRQTGFDAATTADPDRSHDKGLFNVVGRINPTQYLAQQVSDPNSKLQMAIPKKPIDLEQAAWIRNPPVDPTGFVECIPPNPPVPGQPCLYYSQLITEKKREAKELALRNEMGLGLIQSFLMAYLFMALMNHAPRLAQELSGGAKQVPQLGGLGRGASSMAGKLGIGGATGQRFGEAMTIKR